MWFIFIDIDRPFSAERDARDVCASSHMMSTKTPPGHTRDAIFRKKTNRNQTDTNEMTTTETKYQTDFYSAEKYQYLTKF